jgi:hypothetical protein
VIDLPAETSQSISAAKRSPTEVPKAYHSIVWRNELRIKTNFAIQRATSKSEMNTARCRPVKTPVPFTFVTSG